MHTKSSDAHNSFLPPIVSSARNTKNNEEGGNKITDRAKFAVINDNDAQRNTAKTKAQRRRTSTQAAWSVLDSNLEHKRASSQQSNRGNTVIADQQKRSTSQQSNRGVSKPSTKNLRKNLTQSTKNNGFKTDDHPVEVHSSLKNESNKGVELGDSSRTTKGAEQKERIYQEWLSRRTALDLGRPVIRRVKTESDLVFEQGAKSGSNGEAKLATKSGSALNSPARASTPSSLPNQAQYRTKSSQSFTLDCAENASLMGRSHYTGAVIMRLQRCNPTSEHTQTCQPATVENYDKTSLDMPRFDHNVASAHSGVDFGLDECQVRAFREVFDLFDTNGGGSIDADELDDALQSVGIHLNKRDIIDVMAMMDADGNGEIDFDEFLKMMTNTERFLSALTVVNEDKENLLFEVLTEFMKKSALSGVGEITKYYNSKYKRVQAVVPHVVNDYAAATRLIGLSEKQIKLHLERLKGAAPKRGQKSPYANPLQMPKCPMAERALKKAAAAAAMSSKFASASTDTTKLAATSQPPISKKIRLSVVAKCQGDTAAKFHLEPLMENAFDEAPGTNLLKKERLPMLIELKDRGYGWVQQRAEHIEVKLDSNYIRGFLPFDELSTEDMPAVRESVTTATLEYCSNRRRKQVSQNLQHWKALDSRLIRSSTLREYFQSVFSHYSAVRRSLLSVCQS